jgi:hypothetical protein
MPVGPQALPAPLPQLGMVADAAVVDTVEEDVDQDLDAGRRTHHMRIGRRRFPLRWKLIGALTLSIRSTDMIKNPPSAKPRSRSTGNYDIPDRPLGRTPLTSAKSLLCVARQRTIVVMMISPCLGMIQTKTLQRAVTRTTLRLSVRKKNDDKWTGTQGGPGRLGS